MPSAASAAGSISINEINSIIPAAKPREKPKQAVRGFLANHAEYGANEGCATG